MEQIGNWIILGIVILVVYGTVQEIGVKDVFKYLVIALGAGALIFGLYFAYSQLPKHVTVKYRDSKVNISADNFTPLKSPQGSGGGVAGAWYDEQEAYMVIKLDNAYYQHCEMPGDTWNKLNASQAPYLYYSSAIKGEYDCRTRHIPDYQ